MAIDWADLDRTHELDFVMVSPQNLDQTYGLIEGVDRSASSLSGSYYTDTRSSGRLALVNDNWARGSLVRVVHRIPEWGWSREEGTFIVTEDPGSREAGAWRRTLTLHSVLKALALEEGAGPWTVKQGAMAKAAIQQMLSAVGRPFADMSSARDCRFGSTKVYETGSTFLSRMFDLCSLSVNRLDADGHGLVTVTPYVLPARRSAAFRLDLSDARGVVEDGIELSTNFLEMPGRAIVSYRYSETVNGKSVQREVTAHADATGHQSRASRGYLVTDMQQLSEMEPPTYQRALDLAKARLAAKSREQVEWRVRTTYLPVWEGSVVELVVHDGWARYAGTRHCLVKNVELELEHMTMALTLKETAGGDDDE